MNDRKSDYNNLPPLLFILLLISIFISIDACSQDQSDSPQPPNSSTILTDNKSTMIGTAIPLQNTKALKQEINTSIDLLPAKDSVEIMKSLGKYAAIEGIVAEVNILNSSDGNMAALFFNNSGQHIVEYDAWARGETGRDFRAIIRESDLSKFDNPLSYSHRKVRIMGNIERCGSAPAVFLLDSTQLQFIDTPPLSPKNDTLVIEKNLSFKYDHGSYFCGGYSFNAYNERQPEAYTWHINFSITNNNDEWAVEDLRFGNVKIADFIPPKDFLFYHPLISGDLALDNPYYPIIMPKNYVTFNGDYRCVVGDMLTWRWVWIPKLNGQNN